VRRLAPFGHSVRQHVPCSRFDYGVIDDFIVVTDCTCIFCVPQRYTAAESVFRRAAVNDYIIGISYGYAVAVRVFDGNASDLDMFDLI
jgi:hypothetical protein